MSLTNFSPAGNIYLCQGEFGDIPPEDGKSIIFFNSVVVTTKCSVHCSEMEKYNQVVADILGQEVNEETFRQTICTIHPCTLLYNTTCTPTLYNSSL
jgi:hypothetical protein